MREGRPQQVKVIKRAFLSAFEYLKHKNQQDKQAVINALKDKFFLNQWLQYDNPPHLLRPPNAWDILYKILNGIFKFFRVGGVSLLVISGLLVASTLLFLTAPAILMSLAFFSIISSVAGVGFLGVGLVVGLLSLIPKAILMNLDQKHHQSVMRAVLEVTNVPSIDGVTYQREFGFLLMGSLGKQPSSESIDIENYSDDILTAPSETDKNFNYETTGQSSLAIRLR